MPEFSSFIAELVRRYGTAHRLSEAIGMSLSAFSRGVRNEGTLSVENCLRLAEETGEPPSKVLRLASKGQVADLIERLYARVPMKEADREILFLWQNLDSEADRALRTLLRALVADQKRAKKPHRHSA